MLAPSHSRILGFRLSFRTAGPVVIHVCRVEAGAALDLLPERMLEAPPSYADAAARLFLDELEPFAGARNFSVPRAKLPSILTALQDAYLFVHHPARRIIWFDAPHRIVLQTKAHEDGISIAARVVDAEESEAHVDPRAQLFQCGEHLWLFDGHDGMVPLAHPFEKWMEQVLPGPLLLGAGELHRWDDDLYPRLQGKIDIEVNDPFTPQLLTVAPVPVLLLAEKNEDLIVTPCFQYPPSTQLVTPAQRDLVAVGNVRYRRDHPAEVDHTARLRQMIPTAPPDLEGRYYLRGTDALRFLDQEISRLAETWRIEVSEPLRRYKNTPGKPVLLTRIISGIDWFDLKVDIEVVGHRYDAWKLLSAPGPQDDDYVKTPHGFARLEGGVLRLLREHMAELNEGRAHRTQTERLKQFVADFPATETDAAWREAAQKGAWVWPPPKLPVPPELNAVLRPYQQEGFEWLAWLAKNDLGGILADDMGLGKTLQTLALLLHLGLDRLSGESRNPEALLDPGFRREDDLASTGAPEFGHLIVVPSSVVFNWEAEIKRFAPNLRVWKWMGEDRASQLHLLRQADVVITNYTILRKDIEMLQKRRWQSLILDEAQAIKNGQSQTAEAVRRISADFRLALTGTPVENHPAELWSYFEFLMPGFFGSLPAFERRYLPQAAGTQAQGRERLRKRIAPFILRRMKDDVAKDLPLKTEMVIACEMTPPQRELYDTVRGQVKATLLEKIQMEGMAKSGLQVLEALLRLRQVCCDPRLLAAEGKTDEDSGKLTVLYDLLTNAVQEGHKVLVFSQFTKMLDIIEAGLQERSLPHARLDGSTFDRAVPVHRFQTDPECKIFLVSLRAGGTGLNLTAADYVVHYDPWWNPAVEDQATDRAYRIGQNKPVFVYKLIARATVEERIITLQEKKRTWAKELLEGEDPTRSLTVDELRELL